MNNLAGEKEDRILFVFEKKNEYYLSIVFRLFVQEETSRSFFTLSFNLSYSLYSLINQHFKALLYTCISRERKCGQAVVSRAKERSML
jgi:hypothetical protein